VELAEEGEEFLQVAGAWQPATGSEPGRR